MTSLRHNYISPVVDDLDPDIVGPDEWNDDHVSDHAFVVLGTPPANLTGARQLAVSGGLLSLTDAGAGLAVTVGLTAASVVSAVQAAGQALTRVDDTNVTATLTGTPATALLQAVTITMGWLGLLALSRGGTNADLSATGGTSQYLKQVSVGAAITVGVIAAADLPGTFSGFANPSASVGLAVVNGSATTAMRSDAAPPLSQAITPTWTGLHTFQKATDVRMVTFNGTGTGAASWSMLVVSNGDLAVFDDGANNYNARFKTGGVLDIPVGFRISNAAASGNYLRGNGTNFVSNTIQSGDLPGSFSGFANPSASVGLAAVNGAATTAMRSDAAPALSQAIVPTWTGLHVFQKATGNYMVQFDGTGTGAKKWGIVVLTSGNLAIDDVTAGTRALNLITTGILDMPVGYRIGNAAASAHYLRGNGTNYVDSAILAGDLPGSFSGFANPTGTVGLAVVNGSATTAMRSDGAPPLSQAIAPTWTGIHTWSATSGAVPHTINGWAAIGSGLAPFVIKDDSNGSARIELVGSASSSPTFQGLRSGGTIASPTRTLSAAVLAGLDGGGYDNAGTPAVHRRTGSFRAVARNDWTTANLATYWILSTTGPNTTFNDRYYFFDDGSHMGGYMLVAASTITAPTNTTAGDLTSTRYFNLGGRIDLLGATTNQISFGTNGVGAPGAGSAGAKIGLFAAYGSMGSTSEYWIGIESGTMWFNSGQTFKFYFAGTNKFQMDSGAAYLFGYMNVAGSIAVPTNTTAGDFQAIRGFFTTGASFGGTHVPGHAVDIQGNARLRFNTSIGAGTYGRTLYWSDSTPTDIASISAYDVNATNYGLHFFAWNGSSLGGPYFAVSSASVDSLIQTNVQNAYFTSYVNSQTVPTNSAGAGLAVGWNFSGGSAEVTLWNVYSTGGFTFRQRTGSSTSTLLASLDASGNFTVPAAVTGVTGVFTTSSTSPSFFSTSLSTFSHATGNYMIEFIGTGTGAATYGFYVDTNGFFHLDWVANAQMCQWDTSGNYYVFGAHAYKNGSTTAWEIISDARLKNITGLFTDGLALAKQLVPKHFTYNELAPRGQQGTEGLGFIAQEIEELVPYMVNRVDATTLSTSSSINDLRVYDGHALPFILLNAIKELEVRVVELEIPGRPRPTQPEYGDLLARIEALEAAARNN